MKALLLVVLLGLPLNAEAAFRAGGNMSAVRVNHTMTVLPTGDVLVAGGFGAGTPHATTEIYRPSRGFRNGPALSAARNGATATLLRNGKVLIAGGQSSTGSHTSAELFDPVAGTFSPTGPMTFARAFHTATLLASGKVLVVGGIGTSGSMATAELYDPSAGTFAATGNLSTARNGHVAVLLADGRVLVAGGSTAGVPSATAEIYDPSSGGFSATGSLGTARFGATATLIASSGKILVTGGRSTSTGAPLDTAEIFTPSSNTFAPAAGTMSAGRSSHRAAVLPDRTILITGGLTGVDGTTSTVKTDLYDPVGGTFAPGPDMSSARAFQSAALLPTGEILIVGGSTTNNVTTGQNSSELFRDVAPAFTAAGTMNHPHYSHHAILLPNGKVFIAGGASVNGELYDPSDGSFTALSAGPAGGLDFEATLLLNGKVLLTGGIVSGDGVATAQLFDPATNTFSSTGSMLHGRYGHRAVLLGDGRVLVIGGSDGQGTIWTELEIYDPVNGTFTSAGHLNHPRYIPIVNLLPDGKVLIAGGYDGSGDTRTVELFDPADGSLTDAPDMPYVLAGAPSVLLTSGKVLVVHALVSLLFTPETRSWSTTGSKSITRWSATITLLPDGMVLASGGVSGGTPTYYSSTEIYDPIAGTYSDGPTMTAARVYHSATLLPSGKVLIAGGHNAMTSTELYDLGLGFDEAARPTLQSVPDRVCQSESLSITGSAFTRLSEGSSGGTQNSSEVPPLLRLQRVDDSALSYVGVSAWSDTNFSSTLLSSLPFGWYRATIVSGAIPSPLDLIEVTSGAAPILGTYADVDLPRDGTVTVTPSSPPQFPGTFLSFAAPEPAGFPGDTVSDAETGAVTLTQSGSGSGVFTMQVIASTSCTSTSANFNVRVGSTVAPTSVVATATGSTTVEVRWAAVTGASAYKVHRRSMMGITSLGMTTALTVTDTTVGPGEAYLYEVRSVDSAGVESLPGRDLATVVFYTDPTLAAGVTIVKAVHWNELKSAVNAVRALAALGAGSYPSSGPGQVVTSALLIALRDRLDEAITNLGLPAPAFTYPGTAGTTIRAADVEELRTVMR